MSYKSGTGSVCQMYKQSGYGTNSTVTDKTLINMTSEGINYTINKEAEGSLIGSKTEQSRDLMSYVVDGSVSTILKPEFADFILSQAFGIKTAGTDEATYTLAESGASLPVSGIVIRRGSKETGDWNTKDYPDITISSITITAPAQQYVTCDINVMGSRELNSSFTAADGYKFNTIDDSLKFTKGSYRCTSASLVFADSGTEPTAGETCFPVESTTITIDNGLSEAPTTYCDGFYKGQPTMGQRSVTVDFTIPYGIQAENFRKAYYTSEKEVALKLKFTSKDSADEYIEVYLPKVTLTSGSGNVGGSDLIDCSFSGAALTPEGGEPIKATVHHIASV